MKIRTGIIGMGYIGSSHVEAVRRIGSAMIVSVADSNYDLAKKKQEEYGIPECCRSVEELLSDPGIDVVHNCTPNNLHAEINEKIINAGKHVLSEKPLTRTAEEAERLVKLLKKNPRVKGCVNFNYRMNPLVQEIKNKIRNGEIGIPRLAHGSYLQDWLLYDTDYNWRIEPEISGPSRCVADIGSHWIDTVQTAVGSRICEVCSDIATIIPVRKKPKAQAETFSAAASGEYEETEVKTEDYGAVLFRMENGVRGVFHVSEISAGRGCYLNFEIDGSEASVYWNQETCDRMWMGYRDRDNLEIIRNPNNMSAEAKKYTYLAKGHPEGWNDGLKNNIHSFYRYIEDDKQPRDHADFEEAAFIIRVTEAVLESSRTGGWVKLGLHD